MGSVTNEVRRRGGVARVTVLLRMGYTAAQIRSAVARGDVRRLRKGWVTVTDAPTDVVRAVRLGGRLACLSAARHHGLWVPETTEELHIALPRHAGRRFSDSAACTVHWVSANWRDEPATVESVKVLVRQVLLCCDRETAIVIIDSALNQRKLSLSALREIVATVPSRFSSLLDEVDAGSESGLETLCRLRLRGLGARIRSQVSIPGVGRVDLIIGERLVIEADGREWHEGRSAFHADRIRDLALLRLGYVVIRVSYPLIMSEWMLVELSVRALIGRREHLWSATHRREGLAR